MQFFQHRGAGQGGGQQPSGRGVSTIFNSSAGIQCAASHEEGTSHDNKPKRVHPVQAVDSKGEGVEQCNGKHPNCARCAARYNTCVYNVADEGVTRMQHLQQKLQSKTFELDQTGKVLQSLRNSSDNEAAATLAALRLGDSLERVTAALPKHTTSTLRSVQQSWTHFPIPLVFALPSKGRPCEQLVYEEPTRTYTPDEVTSSGIMSPGMLRTASHTYGLEASMIESAFAAHFGVNQVCDPLSRRIGLATKQQ
ncbi:hypothetical protein LTR56_027553 [Elasticomyces elasticus]|nr:hypothetical protein LTR56_027553 [Elasticomyces elasticus]KAK3620572.1 hypothetical protein LTR22_025548 [Elasticomyces elasticus]KAK4904117.1 hypothetical protein LTR49_026371 [Elasticomyces elasticus]KAK5740164.1 hypothetical protein LTS12_025041 [Elasticomyces elasticus]